MTLFIANLFHLGVIIFCVTFAFWPRLIVKDETKLQALKSSKFFMIVRPMSIFALLWAILRFFK